MMYYLTFYGVLSFIVKVVVVYDHVKHKSFIKTTHLSFHCPLVFLPSFLFKEGVNLRPNVIASEDPHLIKD